jgi:nitrate reductase NapE component
MELEFVDGGTKNKAMNEKVILKFEEAAERDSVEIIKLTKRQFWNAFILLSFCIYPVVYYATTLYPDKFIVWLTVAGGLIASIERIYLEHKIKKTIIDLATISMIIDFLKKNKNDSICSR